MSRKVTLFIGLLWSLVLAGKVWAHGGGPGLDYDPCAQRVGDGYIHMASYQPQLNWNQEYCGTIPAAGDTLFVFDLSGAELQHAPLSIKLIDHSGPTLASVPFAAHVTGVINFSALLQSGHRYDAIVAIGKSPTSYVLTFPISVSPWWVPFELPGLLAVAVIFSWVYYGLRLRREHLALVRKTDRRNGIRSIGRGLS